MKRSLDFKPGKFDDQGIPIHGINRSMAANKTNYNNKYKTKYIEHDNYARGAP